MKFNWHSDVISRTTMVDAAYKNTQNVRRFLIQECGADFKFDRDFMTWIQNGASKNMGEVADEWCRRKHVIKSIT